MQNRILHIDGFNLFYRCLTTFTTVKDSGEPIGAFVGFTVCLHQLIERFKPSNVIVVFDGGDAGARRRQIFPNYKGRQSKKIRQVKIGIDNEIESNEDFQLMKIYEMLQQLNVTTISIDYYEADDIIALLVDEFDKEGVTQIIASSDQDYAQKVKENIWWYSFAHKTLYDEDAVKAKYGLSANNLLYRRIITGEDHSDKIEGVGEVGKGSIMKLMPSLATVEIESLEDLLETIKKLPVDEKKKTGNKRLLALKEGEAIIRRNYELCQLTSPRISLTALNELHSYFDPNNIEQQPINVMSVQRWAIKEQLHHSIKVPFNVWIRPFRFLTLLTK